jgi:hypothetical protein
VDDLATLTAASRRITLDDVDYQVPRLTPRMAGRLQAWVKEQIPNPRTEAREHMQGQSDVVAMHIWDLAVEEARDWPPSLDSPEANALLMSPEGQAVFLLTIFGPSIAGFDLARAERIADRITLEDFNRLLQLVSPGEPSDPKG